MTYQGHKSKWKGGWRFADPEGPFKPPARVPRANPYGMPGRGGLEGQIIPPNRGQYPRGKSLPGFPLPKAQLDGMRNMARMQRGLMMRGLLGPIGWAMMLDDFMTSLEGPVNVPFSYNLPNGYGRCPTPNLACENTWGPPTHYHTTPSAGPLCLGFGTCPVNQVDGAMQEIGKPLTLPSTGHEIWWGRLTNPSPARYTIFRRDKRVTLGPAQGYQPRIRSVLLPEMMPAPFYSPSPKNNPLVVTYPRTDEKTRPGTDTANDNREGVAFTPRYPNGVPVKVANRPPLPGEKEKKPLVFRAGALGRTYGALTEWADMADCMIKSMPPDSPCRKARTNVEKAKCIAKNFGSINWPDASMCILNEQAQDAAIGRASGRYRGLGDANPYWRSPVGPGFGGWAMRRAQQDGFNAAGEMQPM